MAKKEDWKKPRFSSYASKDDERDKGISYHDQKNVALLDDTTNFYQNPNYVTAVDRPAKELNEGYGEYPISGDDLAKMGDKRIPTTPTIKHWVDVPQDLANYQSRRSETFHTARQQAGM
jgi:hypothetical protein